MAAHAPEKNNAPKPPKFHGWMAEFADEDAMLKTARKVRDAGYTQTDAFTPFPVHGIDEALGIRPTVLPWIVLCMGITGTITAFTMQIWMNAVDYPYIISGKPFLSIPAFVPVGFELTILFSAFTTFLGMLALNRLVRFSNPVFANPRFDRATDDRFFLYVNSKDKYFNKESVRELLASGSPDSLDEVIEDSTPAAIPTKIWLGLTFLLCLALAPAAVVLNMRASRSDQPRWHVFFDMDFQPKKKAQQQTTLFADGRATRPQVLGTLARGQLPTVDPFYLGYDPTQEVAAIDSDASRFVAIQDAAAEPAAEASADTPATEQPAAEAATEEPKPESTEPAPETPAASDAKDPVEPKAADATGATPPVAAEKPADPVPPAAPAPAAPVDPLAKLAFSVKLPIEATEENMKLGKQKFETYCAACHGYSGAGDGLASLRATALNQGDWLQPTSLHDAKVLEQKVGQIFYTITNGKGKMGSYGGVTSPKERWAIVMYVKALQRAKNAKIDDVPRDLRGSIKGPETN